MTSFSLHSKIRHSDRFGNDLSKARMKSIRDAIKHRSYRLVRYDNVRNRVLEIPHLSVTVVYSDIAQKVVTVWPSGQV